MQQFFLFCTMLIIIFEAFSEKLHGNQILPSIRRKASRFPRTRKYLNSNNFNDLNFPISLVKSASENPDYESSFFVHRGFVPKCDSQHFSLNKLRSSSRKKIFLNKRRQNYLSTSDVPISSQSFKNFWLLGPESCYGPHFFNSFRNIFDFQRHLMKNPNQYIVCFYPIFKRLKKRTFCFLKKPRFTFSKRQYLINLKNKRSANSVLNGTNEVIYKDNKFKVAESDHHHKNIDVNMTDFESPNNNMPPYIDEDASVQKKNENYSENFDIYTSSFESANNFRLNWSLTNNGTSVEEKNKNSRYINNQDNVDLKKSYSESPEKVNFYANNNLGNTERNSLLSPLSSNHKNLYSTHLDVIQPSVSLPKISFKYPCDPILYETSPREESRAILKPLKKETFISEARSETNTKEAFYQNLKKLREILEEVESVLKLSINDKTNKKEKRSKKKKKKDKKNDDLEKLSNATSIKNEIDHLAIPILKNISDELGKISNETVPTTTHQFFTEFGKSKSASKKTDERCSLNGTWTSTVLGIEMTVTVMPNMLLKVSLNSKGEAFINSNWSIHGLTLVKRGGPLMLAAVYPQGRKVASFLGQCKVCKDSDLIFGVWTIYSFVRKYTDLWRAVETKLDILRKKKA